jgi:hypothetical protein
MLGKEGMSQLEYLLFALGTWKARAMPTAVPVVAPTARQRSHRDEFTTI